MLKLRLGGLVCSCLPSSSLAAAAPPLCAPDSTKTEIQWKIRTDYTPTKSTGSFALAGATFVAIVVLACRAYLRRSPRLGRTGWLSKLSHARQWMTVRCGFAERPTRRLFILDRDGVINVDVGAPGVVSKAQFELLPGSAEGIRRLNREDHVVVVVTNQTCVSKGILAESGLVEIHALMEEKLARFGAHVDRILIATQPPSLKPEPTMLFEALELAGMSADAAVMVGDNWTDMQAAAAAGVRGLLVTSSAHGVAAHRRLVHGERPAGKAVASYPDLAAAIDAELRSG